MFGFYVSKRYVMLLPQHLCTLLAFLKRLGIWQAIVS